MYNFSNSLIIQKPKTKRKSCTATCLDIWWKTPRFCILNFPFKISLFEELYQTLITVFHHNIKNLKVHQKIIRYTSYFQLSSQCLVCDETLFLVFDILLHNKEPSTATCAINTWSWPWARDLSTANPLISYIRPVHIVVLVVIIEWNNSFLTTDNVMVVIDIGASNCQLTNAVLGWKK